MVPFQGTFVHFRVWERYVTVIKSISWEGGSPTSEGSEDWEMAFGHF